VLNEIVAVLKERPSGRRVLVLAANALVLAQDARKCFAIDLPPAQIRQKAHLLTSLESPVLDLRRIVWYCDSCLEGIR
jgi:hypothetical protein